MKRSGSINTEDDGRDELVMHQERALLEGELRSFTSPIQVRVRRMADHDANGMCSAPYFMLCRRGCESAVTDTCVVASKNRNNMERI